MNLKEYVKRNKVFSVISIGFIAWIIFLVIFSFFAQREIIFLDALATEVPTDVSSQYTSEIPLARYIVEPFAGLAFFMGFNADMLIGILTIFIIYRIVYLTLKKKGKIKSEKYELLKYCYKDFLRFTFILFAVGIIAVLIILGLSYIFIGFYFVNLHFMFFLQLLIPLGLILVSMKGLLILYKMSRPVLKFNYTQKKRYKKRENPSKALKISGVIRRESVYFFGISFLFLAMGIMLVSTPFPTQEIKTTLAADEILLDFHVHTTMSDGYMTPEERVLWYIDQGINGAAFSDHDNLRGAQMALNFVTTTGLDFHVILAEEWTDHENNIHMNIFWELDNAETIVPLESSSPTSPKALNASDTIKYVKSKGGFVIVNHYNNRENTLYGGIGKPYNYTQLRDWGADGFEIINNGNIYAKEIRAFCLNQSLICLSTTDMHVNEELNSFVRLKLDDPTNLTTANIFKNLYKNTHQAIAITHYPNQVQIPEVLDDLGFGVLENFANYLLNINSLQVVSWIVWSIIGYGILGLIYKKIKKLDVDDLREKIL